MVDLRSKVKALTEVWGTVQWFELRWAYASHISTLLMDSKYAHT